MSIAEVERFAADANSNTALRAEVEAYAKASPSQSAVGLIALAAAKGYSFTTDELREQVKAAGKELSDAKLDGVAGEREFGFGELFVMAAYTAFQMAGGFKVGNSD